MPQHTHVIRTTVEKLSHEIDEWIHDDSPIVPSIIALGGRDLLMIIRHPDHDESMHGKQHVRPHGEVVGPVNVGLYDRTSHTDSSDAIPSWSAWIEDVSRSWILYLDMDGRPTVMWMKRDVDGAVSGTPITFNVE